VSESLWSLSVPVAAVSVAWSRPIAPSVKPRKNHEGYMTFGELSVDSLICLSEKYHWSFSAVLKNQYTQGL